MALDFSDIIILFWHMQPSPLSFSLVLQTQEENGSIFSSGNGARESHHLKSVNSQWLLSSNSNSQTNESMCDQKDKVLKSKETEFKCPDVRDRPNTGGFQQRLFKSTLHAMKPLRVMERNTSGRISGQENARATQSKISGGRLLRFESVLFCF